MGAIPNKSNTNIFQMHRYMCIFYALLWFQWCLIGVKQTTRKNEHVFDCCCLKHSQGQISYTLLKIKRIIILKILFEKQGRKYISDFYFNWKGMSMPQVLVVWINVGQHKSMTYREYYFRK